MLNKLLKMLPIALSLFLLGGCASSHYSEAILLALEEPPAGSPPTQKVYSPVIVDGQSEGNSIYIGSDTKFSVDLSQIYLGWLHRNRLPGTQGEESGGNFSAFKDKELWLLITIRSRSNEDPMELQSKRYFKVSNVKFRSEAYQNLSLDQLEREVFAHLADSAYNIKFDIYEVDGFDIKREISAASQNPGISGVVVDAVKTSANIVSATMGDHIMSRLKSEFGDPLAVERLLLKQGGVLEFSGSIDILRGEKFADSNPGIFREREFMLLDYYKSELSDADKGKDLENLLPSDGTLSDRVEHKEKLSTLRSKACVGGQSCVDLPLSDLSYMRFVLREAPSNQEFDTALLVKETLKNRMVDTNNNIRKLAGELETELSADLGGNVSLRSTSTVLITQGDREERGIDGAMPQVGNDIQIMIRNLKNIDLLLTSISREAVNSRAEAGALWARIQKSKEILSDVKPLLAEYRELEEFKNLSDRELKGFQKLMARPAD